MRQNGKSPQEVQDLGPESAINRDEQDWQMDRFVRKYEKLSVEYLVFQMSFYFVFTSHLREDIEQKVDSSVWSSRAMSGLEI